MKKKIVLSLIAIVVLIVAIIVVVNVKKENRVNGAEPLQSIFAYITKIHERGIVIEPVATLENESLPNEIEVEYVSTEGFEVGEKIQVLFVMSEQKEYPNRIIAKQINRKIDIAKSTELYLKLVEEIMKADDALNYQMEYISIDFGTFKNVNDINVGLTVEEKEDIKNFLRSYDVEILEMSMEELKENGKADKFGNLLGVAISIDSIKQERDNKINVSIEKYKSGLGAIWLIYDAEYINGEWQLELINTAMA